MTRSAALIWVPLGFVVSVVDGWLSILSLLGTINPNSLLGYVVAGGLGVGLTLFAILFPVMRSVDTSSLLVAAWVLFLAFDVATSVVASIWYGFLENPLGSAVEYDELVFAPENWTGTLLFAAAVILAYYCCYKLGEALKVLLNASAPAAQGHY